MYEDPQAMFREMDEMFSRIFARMNAGMELKSDPQRYGYRIIIQGGDGTFMAEEPPRAERTTGSPAAEVHRLGDEVKVIVELPGADAASVRLATCNQKLVIDADGCGSTYHTDTDLPADIDLGSMNHTFKNGVLEVTFASCPAGTKTDGV